jgi:hypothetical protein
MEVAVMFILGALTGACLAVIVYCTVSLRDMRSSRRGGYIDLTHMKGGTHRPDLDEAEGLSGAGTSPRPHLHVVEGSRDE